ncbi:MAG: methyltransferase domain-containing protein [Bacteroidota bacterium]
MSINIDPVLKDAEKVSKRSTSFLVHHYLYKAIACSAEKHAKGKVLDIGCGYKPYQKLFNENKQVTGYTGCDVNQTSLNTVDIICDAEKIPLPDKSIDTVFCTQVIEHVFEKEALLKESYRLLTDEGKIIISGPLYWPVHGEPHDFFRFTKFGFEKLLNQSGFTVIETLENGGAWATAGQALVHSFEFSSKKTFLFRVLRFMFFRLRFIVLTNSIFRWLDKKDYNPVSTINYVVVAKKVNKS